MKKNFEKLINDFKKVESELIEILNEKGVFIDENENKAVVKKSLKEYIKKVNKAKKLFEEYETLAKQIEDIDSDDDDLPELSRVVLEFRESVQVESQERNFDEKKVSKKSKKSDEKKNKKKNNEPVKEF